MDPCGSGSATRLVNLTYQNLEFTCRCQYGNCTFLQCFGSAYNKCGSGSRASAEYGFRIRIPDPSTYFFLSKYGIHFGYSLQKIEIFDYSLFYKIGIYMQI